MSSVPSTMSSIGLADRGEPAGVRFGDRARRLVGRRGPAGVGGDRSAAGGVVGRRGVGGVVGDRARRQADATGGDEPPRELSSHRVSSPPSTRQNHGRPVNLLRGSATCPDLRSRRGEFLRERGDVAGEHGGEPVTEGLGERGARTVGAHGDRHAAAAGDRRQDEVAVGRLVGGIHPDPLGPRGRRHVGVDDAVTGSRDHQSRTVEIAGFERAFMHLGTAAAVEGGGDVPGHHSDHGAGVGEHRGLPGAHRPGADDQHVHSVEIDEHRIAEPRRLRSVGGRWHVTWSGAYSLQS